MGTLIALTPDMHIAYSQSLLDLADNLRIARKVKSLKDIAKFYCDAIAIFLQLKI